MLLMEWNNQPAPTIGRINPLNSKAQAEVESYAKATPIDGLDGYIKIDGPPPGEWMKEGLVYIQDPATRHAVELLAPQPGEKILDACAAPGGKSSLIAAAMGNDGELTCTDSNEKRIPRLNTNLERLGVKIATVKTQDWTQPAPAEWHGTFDAILLDVPCSNTGVMRRRLDARWRLRGEDIVNLTHIQEAILENALPCLKKGGRLVYSTCSIEPDENHDLVTRWIQNHPDWEIETEQQSLPFRDNSDGAYAALISRSKTAQG
jgi:16S rRNA (cytosine967-C5)-methyltransferase